MAILLAVTVLFVVQPVLPQTTHPPNWSVLNAEQQQEWNSNCNPPSSPALERWCALSLRLGVPLGEPSVAVVTTRNTAKLHLLVDEASCRGLGVVTVSIDNMPFGILPTGGITPSMLMGRHTVSATGVINGGSYVWSPARIVLGPEGFTYSFRCGMSKTQKWLIALGVAAGTAAVVACVKSNTCGDIIPATLANAPTATPPAADTSSVTDTRVSWVPAMNNTPTFFTPRRNMFFSDGTTIRIGNNTFFSNGTTATQVGNNTFFSNGTTATQIGNNTFFTNGTTATQIGNNIFFSDGTSATRNGNFTFFSTGKTCTTIGNITTCS
jgi:hypothetical protein